MRIIKNKFFAKQKELGDGLPLLSKKTALFDKFLVLQAPKNHFFRFLSRSANL